MRRLKPPPVPEEPVPALDDDALRRLFETCQGCGFDERRDTAILYLFLDAGPRLEELAGIRVGDIDFNLDVIHVVGKGGRTHALPFGNRTGQALDQYLRARARHPHAKAEALWLGKKGGLARSGVAQVVRRCAASTADARAGEAHRRLSPVDRL